MTSDAGSLTSDVHEQILKDEILPKSGMDRRTSHEVPKAVILAGQPGSGKGALARQVRAELNNDVITVDPDELREDHRHFNVLREQHPYTWAGHTHSDASEWAKQLRSIAIDGRKNLLIDTTLGNAESAVSLIKNLQANGYEVEIRGVVAHRLESELGVDGRFTTSLDTEGFGRYVPEEVRKHVYEALPGNLDKVQAETAIQIRLYGREGAQVYDSHSDTRVPGAALEAEREARLKDPRTTQVLREAWRAQGRWHDELADTLPRNNKVSPTTAAAVFDERASLSVVEGVAHNIHEARAIDHTVRVRPNMVRGAVIGGTAATVVEAITEGTKVADLYARDNRTGAEAALLDFGARSVGGWTGAALGAKAGTMAGIESGPGAIVTGIIGAGLGTWGGSEIVEWVEKFQINNQTDSFGRVWTFNPMHPEKGWTHNQREIIGSVGTLADRPLYGAETDLTADAALTQQLNYQASSRAIGLRLSEPDRPINPFSIAGDATDTPSLLPRSWERNPENGEWRREVVHQVLEHGIKSTTVEVADARKAAELDHDAEITMAYNAARSPAAFAKQYEQAYVAQGWSRYGEIPEEVVWARNHPDNVLASDGRTYQRQADGEWLHDGWIYDSLAEGNVRDELNGTYPLIRAIQQMEAPIPGAQEHRIEALTATERDAYEQATHEANRLGVAAPNVQHVAAAAVAEVRGERAEDRIASQAVMDEHTELRASPAPSVPPPVREHRTSTPAVPTPSIDKQPERDHPRSELPRRQADAAAARSEAEESGRQPPHAEGTSPAEQTAPDPVMPSGTHAVDSSLAKPQAGAPRASDVEQAAPSPDRFMGQVHSTAQRTSSQGDDAAPMTPRHHEADSKPAPTQPDSAATASWAAAEPAAPEQTAASHSDIIQHPLPKVSPPLEDQVATPSVATNPREPKATSAPRLPNQADHPDYTLYQQIREGVAALDAKHGRTFDETSERVSASLLVLAKDNDLDRVDHVLLSNATADKPSGHTLFLVQGDPNDPLHQRAAMSTELAATTSVEESLQQFDVVSREAQQRAVANQLEQQLEDQRVQHDIQIRAAAGMG
ncbi:zeta toxin family protein [Stenotrophomonas maltophilia]|uniref:zeta toxin family protein n=1 Tax=Stenotrophomonas maltophilia TaxID=40324 RepID=UPI001EF98614|nr:zeta toxin family protein [Stenotrophomonas maltophilia]